MRTETTTTATCTTCTSDAQKRACGLHPECVYHVCPGCGRSFNSARGLNSHRTARFTSMGCRK